VELKGFEISIYSQYSDRVNQRAKAERNGAFASRC